MEYEQVNYNETVVDAEYFRNVQGLYDDNWINIVVDDNGVSRWTKDQL